MPALSEYSNVYNTALLVLSAKGFRLWFDSGRQLYCAEKEGWDFEAETPCGLLGLIAIYETQQPSSYTEYWWRKDGPNLYGKLPTEAPAYEPVWRRSQ